MIRDCKGFWNFATDVQGHLRCQIIVDVVQAFDHLLNDVRLVELVELKGESFDDVGLLVRMKRVIEKLGLIIVFLEFGRAKALLYAYNLLWVPVHTSSIPTMMCECITYSDMTPAAWNLFPWGAAVPNRLGQ